ncbi:hypothetical protein K461DRAFT_294701 [Myriangium duriaei CBS 260.36]|uniref:Rhodopsin domain-containing protein n=1 Tax=Myriangium duriaei CBS 260.36 TaxID=1168546 RepID=A0A9P4J000_9PEZI|nr:hypothetical protein K461DRAFT_294701 [Myriangium duriaei CBS 260.36]
MTKGHELASTTFTAETLAEMRDQVLIEVDTIRVIVIVMLIFVCMSVAVRMYVRIRMLKQFGPEDWSMLAAFLLSVAQCSVAFGALDAAERVSNGNVKSTPMFKQLTRVRNGIFSLAMIALKVSLGLFFLKIFSHKRLQKIVIWILCILTMLVGIAYFGVATFTCYELKEVPGLPETCPVQPVGSAIFVAFSVISMASDYIFTGMAVVALWQAKLRLHTKLPACFLLVLGAVGGIASTIRFSLLVEPVTVDTFTFAIFNIGKWTIIELSVGIIAANLAMTRPLLHACLVRVKGISDLTTSKTRTPTGMATKTNKSIPLGTVNGPSLPNQALQRNKGRMGRNANDDADSDLNGEAYLLTDIKREVTVAVDEERLSGRHDPGMAPAHYHARYYGASMRRSSRADM